MAEKNHHILLGVTGSIAAYKAVELLRLMRKRDWSVSVVMTRAAREFVGEITFRTLSRNPVLVDEFAPVAEWDPAHIALADRAGACVIAPCTANVIAKIAHGLADDALTSTVLACPAPLVVAPAMNQNMWRNAATGENIGILRKRGAVVVEPAKGELACGCEGEGRLAPLEKIMAAVEKALSLKKRWIGCRKP